MLCCLLRSARTNLFACNSISHLSTVLFQNLVNSVAIFQIHDSSIIRKRENTIPFRNSLLHITIRSSRSSPSSASSLLLFYLSGSKRADQFCCCDGFPRNAPKQDQSAAILDRGEKKEGRWVTFTPSAIVRGSASAPTATPPPRRTLGPPTAASTTTGCSASRSTASGRNSRGRFRLELIRHLLHPAKNASKDGGQFLEIEAEFSESEGIPSDVSAASDIAAFRLMGRSAAASPARRAAFMSSFEGPSLLSSPLYLQNGILIPRFRCPRALVRFSICWWRASGADFATKRKIFDHFDE